MKQILSVHGFPKEVITALMMLSKNTKAVYRSPGGDINFLESSLESFKNIY